MVIRKNRMCVAAREAARLHALVKILAQLREGDAAKVFQQPVFRFLKGVVECAIDGLFHQTAGCFGAIAHGEQRGFVECAVNVMEGDVGKRPTDLPAATVTFGGADQLVLTQTGVMLWWAALLSGLVFVALLPWLLAQPAFADGSLRPVLPDWARLADVKEPASAAPRIIANRNRRR